MIDVLTKIYSDDLRGQGTYAQVTVNSLQNLAVLVGHDSTLPEIVVYFDELDGFIEALQALREQYVK